MIIKISLKLFLFVLLLGPIIAIAGEWKELDAQVTQAYHAGDYSKAEKLAEKAYSIALNEFGWKHPNTLISMNDQAMAYDSQGLYKEAEPLYVETLTLRKEVLGNKHPRYVIQHEQSGLIVSITGLL